MRSHMWYEFPIATIMRSRLSTGKVFPFAKVVRLFILPVVKCFQFTRVYEFPIAKWVRFSDPPEGRFPVRPVGKSI